ncbi:MAG: Crp/Fnr family transcriptional regulator [Myxococcales bacterium]|nr:Crp/Fnr family transcriptional regulator [Myxococcales bacterium]
MTIPPRERQHTDPHLKRVVQAFEAGTIVFDVGDEPGPMYVIQSGRVRIERKRGRGLETVAELGQGDFFGELAIFNGRRRSLRATVVESGNLLVIEPKTLAAMLKNQPEVAVRLLQSMAKRLDSANALVEVHSERDPVARVVLELARLADHESIVTESGRLYVSTERKTIAERLSVPETLVARALRRLSRLGLAFEVDRGVEVYDPDRLREFRAFLLERTL